MIKSMTGFGKYRVQSGSRIINIGIKSLNSKSLDFNLKAPSLFREKESEIRAIAGNMLSRGKVEISFHEESSDEQTGASINKTLFKHYYHDLKLLLSELQESTDIVPIISRFPDIFKSSNEELSEESWADFKEGLVKALKDLDQFRMDEGKNLAADLEKRVQLISSYLQEVASMESERIETVRARIKKNMEEFLDPSNINQDRFEQEMIYYLEKFDITEEKTRLKTHCAYFLETMNLGESSGKKLGFISQEIGREINTIGSKANHAEIQKLVVQMKDELEKIKEQLLNVL